MPQAHGDIVAVMRHKCTTFELEMIDCVFYAHPRVTSHCIVLSCFAPPGNSARNGKNEQKTPLWIPHFHMGNQGPQGAKINGVFMFAKRFTYTTLDDADFLRTTVCDSY